MQQTNSKQQTETNQQSTIVTQQGAYAYPVPIGNSRFRAKSRLRKKEEEEEAYQERERRCSIFHLAEKPDGQRCRFPIILETSHPFAISMCDALLRPFRHMPVQDRWFQRNLRTHFITKVGSNAIVPVPVGEPVFFGESVQTGQIEIDFFGVQSVDTDVQHLIYWQGNRVCPLFCFILLHTTFIQQLIFIK